MKYYYIILLILFTVLCSACEDSLTKSLSECEIQVSVVMPDDMPEGTITSESYSFLNVSTGKRYNQNTSTVSLIPGLYDIGYEASMVSSDGKSFRLRAFRQSCVLMDDINAVSLDAHVIIDTDDLIISEVFFTCTLQPSGNNYNGDDYVKLYNNTDHVIYADGITLFESKFTTTEKNLYTPDIMAEAMTVQALYTVPGDGTQHPVAPGEFLLLADNGIDHRVANPQSFDLSAADFEWYDVSSSPSNLDIDSPTVPNLDKWYCYTRTYWMLHNRGLKAFGIARIPVDKDTYLQDYLYSYDYEVVTAAGTFPMSAQAYRLPNEWIVDVVNCSVASDYAWCVCDPSLDCGWTSCGSIMNDKQRFFKAVRRKLLYINEHGQPILKDTNDSTVDFNASVTPSEIERQSAMPLTYDGITPITE